MNSLQIDTCHRNGKMIRKLTAYNRDTKRVACVTEDGVEQTYDHADILHHHGEAGKRAHFRAAGLIL